MGEGERVGERRRGGEGRRRRGVGEFQIAKAMRIDRARIAEIRSADHPIKPCFDRPKRELSGEIIPRVCLFHLWINQSINQ